MKLPPATRQGHVDQRNPARRRNQQRTSDRAWTGAPALVFSECSLAGGSLAGRSRARAARGVHFLIELPGSAAVAGDLAAPAKRCWFDVGEAPPQLRVVLVADEHDLLAGGAADQATHTAVDRFDPGGARRRSRRRRSGSSSREKPAGPCSRLVGRGRGRSRCPAPRGRRAPSRSAARRSGADELSKQAKLVGVRPGRARHVERLDQPAAGPRGIGLSRHGCSSIRV